MSFRVLKERQADTVTVSSIYFDSLQKLMAENRSVMHVEADLGLSVLGPSMYALKKQFPGQVLDCGIQEGNMVSVAAGMSVCGKIPFAHSFAPFISRRACDQAFISCAYNKANVKLIGSDPGVMAAFNGGTHMPFEDIAIMRAMPEMTVIEFADAAMAAWLFPAVVEHPGNVYIRFMRKNTEAVYEMGSSFTIGKANLLQEGTDVTLIGSGIMVAQCLKAAALLAEDGISARVVDMFTIKPIDRDIIIESAQKTGAIVTAENHNIIGGLGSAVSDVLCETKFVPIEKVGVQDQFGQVGSVGELLSVYGLTPDAIAEKAKKAITRKG